MMFSGMPAVPASCVILLLGCIQLVVCDNNCPAGTFNYAGGVKCEAATTWKFATGYPACLGALSASTMNYNAALKHCTDQGGQMILPTSVVQNNVVQTWRGGNSAAKPTWLSGQRVKSNHNDCWWGLEEWSKWTWTHFAATYSSGSNPWDNGEPKSECYPGEEKCYSMNANGRWKDRRCSDTSEVFGLCQKSYLSCDTCTTASCGAGQYRTSCSAGSKADSVCANCNNNPAQCKANHHRKQCTSGGTENTCTACAARTPACSVAGVWWKECDTAALTDTGSCQNCLEVTCKANEFKQLCAANGIAQGQNRCRNCARTSCAPGEFLTRCNHLTDLSDTSKCTVCTKTTCGVGTYRKTCEPGQNADTCPSCTTAVCGIGQFRARCDGSQVANAACQMCADTIVCPQNSYKVLCDGMVNGLERNSSSCNTCPLNSGSSAGSTGIAA